MLGASGRVRIETVRHATSLNTHTLGQLLLETQMSYLVITWRHGYRRCHTCQSIEQVVDQIDSDHADSWDLYVVANSELRELVSTQLQR